MDWNILSGIWWKKSWPSIIQSVLIKNHFCLYFYFLFICKNCSVETENNDNVIIYLSKLQLCLIAIPILSFSVWKRDLISSHNLIYYRYIHFVFIYVKDLTVILEYNTSNLLEYFCRVGKKYSVQFKDKTKQWNDAAAERTKFVFMRDFFKSY